MFSSPFGSSVAFLSMTGRETMGRPFSFEVDLLSDSDSLDLKEILAKPASVIMERMDGTLREFNGLVTELSLVGEHGKFTRYRCVMRPALWFIGQNRKCRIFQNQSVPEIVQDLLRERGVTDFENLISDTHRKWEFLVQYRESDLNFINRILEQEGIYYFFKHHDGKHTLVLLDSSASHEAPDRFAEVRYCAPQESKNPLEEYIDSWFTKRQIRPDMVTLVDFNYESPLPFATESAIAPLDNDHGDAEVYDFPAEAIDKDQAEVQAKRRLEELQADHELITGAGPVRGLYAGAKFKLKDFPRDDQNKDYVIVSASYEISAAQFESNTVDTEQPAFRFAFNAIDAKRQYRSPSITKKPIVEGPQTALVVGPEDKEFFADTGRVKLKFHWDPDPKADASSSCFVRVAHAWAGDGWGSSHIPRIGQEVIVSFLEGDPDRPIITGSVYNGFNRSPYPSPSQSGFKSHSTPGGSPDNFNEIRFEDKKGEEELHIQAEKTMSTLVKKDRSASVGGGDAVSVGGDRSLSVTGKLSETIKGGESKHDVTGNFILTASDTISATATNTLTLKVGGSTIVLTQNDITLHTCGTTVKLDFAVDAISEGKGHLRLDTNAFMEGSGKANLFLSDFLRAKSAVGSEFAMNADATLSALTEIKMKALSVSAEGQIDATLKGGTGTVQCTLAGTVVGGTMVNVNGDAQVGIGGPIIKIG